MKVKRLLLGESESMVTTGMPAADAASIASRNSSGSAADTRMPAGGIFRCTTSRHCSFSALGAQVSGPTISEFTPISRAAARRPAAASCQYAIFVLALTSTKASPASCRPPQAHNRDIAPTVRTTEGLVMICIASLRKGLSRHEYTSVGGGTQSVGEFALRPTVRRSPAQHGGIDKK